MAPQRLRAGAQRHLQQCHPAAAILLAAAVGILFLIQPVSPLSPRRDDAFVGWRGEIYQGSAAHGISNATGDRRQWVQAVSWKPRAFIYHNFLSNAEAEHIKKLSAPTMRRSTVVGAKGDSVLDDYRTSFGTFIKRRTDPIIEALEERIALWARIPAINAEDMQVLRYGQGQQYKPHMDSLADGAAGPRVCTVLLYLNDVPEGGETAFPDSNNWIDPTMPQREGPFSPCASGHLAFKPRKGDAFMFWSVTPDGQQDEASMHTGCPVLKGVKWTATKWIHGKPFRPESYNNTTPEPVIDPGLCQDTEQACADWAAHGECEKNAKYMVGDVGGAGHCQRSCGACMQCPAGNRTCYNENRRKAGYLVYSDTDLDNDPDLRGMGA